VSRTILSPLVLWRNVDWFWDPKQETVTVILSYKSSNRSCRFWGWNRETRAIGFKVKAGETITIGFYAKPLTNRPSGFQTIPLTNHHNGFETKPLINYPPWFWCSTKKYVLLVHGADHTRYHLTSWSSSHRVSDLCLTIPNPLHQIFYSCLDPHRYSPYRTYHQHTMRQANTILHTKQRIQEKLTKYPGFEFKPRYVNGSSHIKPRYWSHGFSISLLMRALKTKGTKFEVRIQDPMKHS
jgi:hypothetical protein